MATRLVLIGCAALALVACKKQEKPQQQPPAVPSAVVQAHQLRSPDKPLAAGDPAPALEAVAHTGERVELSRYKGRPVVLYFYPKDDSPGCTAEAQGLRDAQVALKKQQAVVLGVSADDNVSHRAFASKNDLTFRLLPDTEHRIAKAYGVPVKNGHDMRYTFIIDKQGRIAKVMPNVDPRQNAKLVLDELGKLAG
jgi:peroxiredoxin Q/BCP